MDASGFRHPAGQIVSIDGGKESAFIPSSLPEEWEPSLALVPQWVQAREILGELRGTGRALHDHVLLIRPLRQREALRSSSLEGTYATPAELLAYEMDPRDPHSSLDPANTWREVFNYQRALEQGQSLVEEGYPFSEWFIRQLHQVLLSGVRGDDKSPGSIRNNQVHIGAGHRFTPPPPEHLLDLMGRLEKEIQTPTKIDPLIRAFMVHYQFETIHPFRDGNGRVGRLLLALMIYRECGFDLPWLYLSEFFEHHKDEYIDSLYSVSSESHWDRFIKFCLQATIESGRSTINRITKLIKTKESYEQRIREHDGRDRLVHVIPKLLSNPIVKYKDLMDILNISYPTARSDMEALIEMGIVRELGKSKNPKTYYAYEIFQIAYFDDSLS
ncbi:MAG: Fic family protein [Gammaproteobacteria bacterium]|uniref:Fic family protein n=1 Tax=Thalassobaculum sp. TaxID=2022740 RepID=UPI0032EFE221